MDAQYPDLTHHIVSALPVRRLKLVHDARAAESEQKRRNVYLATVAHEMRNALAPLTSAIDLVALHVPDDPDLQDLVPVVRRQLKQLVRLTDDLLDIGRAVNNEFDLVMEPESVQEMVEGVVAAWRTRAQLKHQALTVTLPPAPIIVLADRVRLGQAFQNVLANAVKFTPDGGHIEVSVLPTDAGVAITVEDSGIGIPTGELASVFELFNKARGERAPAGGFGIGLALSRKLVELHGGAIVATSEGLGKGAAFAVTLPRTAALKPSGAG